MNPSRRSIPAVFPWMDDALVVEGAGGGALAGVADAQAQTAVRPSAASALVLVGIRKTYEKTATATTTAVGSFLVLVRPLHPEKRLDIDHVPRLQVPQILRHPLGELEQIGVSGPVRTGLVLEIEAVLFRR